MEISCLTANIRPVTTLVEKKSAIRKKFKKNSGFQLYALKGLHANRHKVAQYTLLLTY